MVDSVSYLPTELSGAALQMGQHYKLHHIKPSSAYSPDVLCSQKYSSPPASRRELVLVCGLFLLFAALAMGCTPQPLGKAGRWASRRGPTLLSCPTPRGALLLVREIWVSPDPRCVK